MELQDRPPLLRIALSLALLTIGLFSVGVGAAEPGAAVGETRSASRVQVWNAPPVDVSRLLAEDEANRSTPGAPLRLGWSIKAGLSPDNSGTWETLPSGDRIWRLVVRSEGARWLVLGFGTYRLQPGGRLEVHDPARRTVLGPFTSEHVRADGQLWLPPIEGDSVVLELFWPKQLAGVTPNIHLGKVSHGYQPWGGVGTAPVTDDRPPPDGPASEAATAGFCNVDVNCPLGADWQVRKLGVVQLLIDGQVACSGSLVNNTNVDCHPYVLTAWHCFHIRGPGMDPIDFDPATTTFRFNFEQPLCGGSETNLPNQTTTGATFVSQWTGSDFVLLELNNPPPSNFAHYFNGWNRSPAPASSSWTIHHPTGDVRKISFNNDPLINGQFFGPFHWRVGQWEVGTTQGGSSGAPLFDQDQRIIGQLHGGMADCEEFLFDEFGKLDASWNGLPGGTSTTRLSNWLDPGNAGLVTLDGLDPLDCTFPQPRLVRRSHAANDQLGNRNGVLEPGDTFTLQVELQNNGTLPATGVTATLSTTDAGVTIPFNQATWSDLAQIQTAHSQQPFTLQIGPEFPCGDPVHLNLLVSAQQGNWGYPIVLETGAVQLTEMFSDDMESGINGWTVQTATGPGLNPNSWNQIQCVPAPPQENCTGPGERSNSLSHSWFVPDIAVKSDTMLIRPAIGPLPEEAVLGFTHYINSERGFDGGVLEYSINNGVTWLDARLFITKGGYNSTIGSITGSTLAGRQAWSGDLGSFQDVEVDLSSLAGQTVLLRWRFATDLVGADDGWYIDDLQLDDLDHVCTPQRTRVFPGDRCNGGLPMTPGTRPSTCGPIRPRP